MKNEEAEVHINKNMQAAIQNEPRSTVNTNGCSSKKKQETAFMPSLPWWLYQGERRVSGVIA